MIEKTKELRVQIDGLYQLTKELKPLLIDDGNDYTWNIKSISPENETDSRIGIDYFLTANSKEVNASVDSLILAKAWLGKLLGELGSDNPYSSGKKEVKDIEPTADTDLLMGKALKEIYLVDDNMKLWSKNSHIEKVDWLRSEIQEVIDEIKAPDFASAFSTRESAIARTNTYTHLCEAKIHLGFEFQRIREENKTDK